MTDHLREARHYAARADEALKRVDDPGQEAEVLAHLALTHGVLEAAENLRVFRSTLVEMEDTFRSIGR